MRNLFFLIIFMPALLGCDRIYGLLHKPGGEERQILGSVVFNEYNAKVEQVQKYLRLLGYHVGRPDGKFGASTRDAVVKFQVDEGIEVTRFVDKVTWARLQYYLQRPLVKNDVISGASVQKALLKAGYDPGKIDGQMGNRTKAALRRFQTDQGLFADGLMGLKTMKALMNTTQEKVK